MKTKIANLKRHISLLLAFCLVAAIVPTGYVAEASGTAVMPIEVNFNSNGATELALESNHTAASFDTGFDYEIATVNNEVNARFVRAYPTNVQVSTQSGRTLAVFKVKIPAGTYRVFMKVPNVAAGANAKKLSFSIGGQIGGTPSQIEQDGPKAFRYGGGTVLGAYDFSLAGAMNKTHMFENIVTLPEVEGNGFTVTIGEGEMASAYRLLSVK